MAARKPRTASKKKKPEQPHLPAAGMKADVHPDVESAGEEYLEIQEERRDLAAKAKDAKQELIDAMQRHGVEKYRVGDHIVEVGKKDVVRVKKHKEPKADTSDGFDD